MTQKDTNVQKQQMANLQWTLVTTTSFVPKDVAIKMNLLLYRILNKNIDMLERSC